MKMIDALKNVIDLASLEDASGGRAGPLDEEAIARVNEIVEAVETGETGKLGAYRFWTDDK